MKKNYEHRILGISELTTYENNPRTHSDDQITQVANSITEFGFTNPVLINENNQIIAGHCRVIAAEKLNIESVPCIVVNGLNEAQMKALVIADNQLALNAEWNIDVLTSELDILKDMDFDIDLLGFSDDFLNGLNFDCETKIPDDFKEVDEQNLDTTCPKCGFEFDK